MTSKEFIIWLKGFTEGVHDFNITPKQWDLLKEKLAEVNDNTFVETPGMFQVHPQPTYPPYWDPYNPYKVTCRGEETPTGTTITTTPGQSSITIANPPFGFGVTSTAYGYPSGSAWSYTTSNEKVF
jgi:hypothetical protein